MLQIRAVGRVSWDLANRVSRNCSCVPVGAGGDAVLVGSVEEGAGWARWIAELDRCRICVVQVEGVRPVARCNTLVLSGYQGEASCARSNTSRSSDIQELGRLVRAGSDAEVVQVEWKGSSAARDAAEVLGVEPGLEWAVACVDGLADLVRGSRDGAYVLVQARANAGLVCSVEEEV